MENMENERGHYLYHPYTITVTEITTPTPPPSPRLPALVRLTSPGTSLNPPRDSYEATFLSLQNEHDHAQLSATYPLEKPSHEHGKSWCARATNAESRNGNQNEEGGKTKELNLDSEPRTRHSRTWTAILLIMIIAFLGLGAAMIYLMASEKLHVSLGGVVLAFVVVPVVWRVGGEVVRWGAWGRREKGKGGEGMV